MQNSTTSFDPAPFVGCSHCPVCDALVLVTARTCHKCGADLLPVPTAPEIAGADVSEVGRLIALFFAGQVPQQ